MAWLDWYCSARDGADRDMPFVFSAWPEYAWPLTVGPSCNNGPKIELE